MTSTGHEHQPALSPPFAGPRRSPRGKLRRTPRALSAYSRATPPFCSPPVPTASCSTALSSRRWRAARSGPACVTSSTPTSRSCSVSRTAPRCSPPTSTRSGKPRARTTRRRRTVVSLRDAGAMLSRAEAGLAAYLMALLNWHRRHRFCANCGAPTPIAEAGYSRRCRLRRAHFPRTDPVVIMLVEHDGGLLLGRRAGWPDGGISILAGLRRAGRDARGGGRPRGERGVRDRRPRPRASYLAAVAVPVLADARVRSAQRWWRPTANDGSPTSAGSLATNSERLSPRWARSSSHRGSRSPGS